MSAAKRKRNEDDGAVSTPASKMPKQEEVTRSGRVRKKPAKFLDKGKKEASVPEPQALLVPQIKPEPPPEPEPVITRPVETVVDEPSIAASITLEQSMSNLEDSGRSSGRARKKSAKVREMEEFEEMEKKQFTKKTPGGAVSHKAVSPVEAISILPTPKKHKTKQSPEGTPVVLNTLTAALAARLQSSTAAALLNKVKAKVEPMVVSVHPEKTTQIQTSSPVKLSTATTQSVSSPNTSQNLALSQALGGALMVSPGGIKSEVEQGGMLIKTKSPQGSVIKLLLNSPTQQQNPVLSTKTITQSASPPETIPPPSNKKKKAKEKNPTTTTVENRQAAPVLQNIQSKQISESDIPKLKFLLGSGSQIISPAKQVPLIDDTCNPILASASLSPTGKTKDQNKQPHVKLLISPKGQTKVQAMDEIPKMPPKKSQTANKSPKEMKSKKPKKSKQDTKTADSDTAVVVMSEPAEMLQVSLKEKESKKKKSKPKVDHPIPQIVHKEFLDDSDYELGMTEVTLGEEEEEEDDSFMDIEEDEEEDEDMEEGDLMISHETPPKTKSDKKKGKSKGGKTGADIGGTSIQLGDLPGAGEPLVMDLDKMKPDEKKKASKKKAKEQPDPEKNKKKRAPTAYMIWCNIHRPKLVEENPGIDFSTISKRLGEMWSSQSEKEKLVWRRKAKKLAGRGSTLITTGKVPAGKAAASKHAQPAQAIPVAVLTSSGATKLITSQLVTAAAKAPRVIADEPFSPVKGFGSDPVDVSAHLKLIGESLSIIGMRLQEHRGLIAVQGSLSVLLDSMLCACGPLMCLTQQLPELDGCPAQTHMSVLDNIAYIMPGL